MTTDHLFPLCQEAIQSLDPHYRPAMQQALAGAGLEGRDWGLLLLAQGAEPQALSAEQAHMLRPYTTVAALERRMAEAAESGWLARDGDAYRMAEAGRAALARIFGAVHAALAGFGPLPAADLRRLADLLGRLVEASQAAGAPADKPHLVASRRSDPGSDGPPAARADQYLTDLIAFRDDVHPVTWRATGVDGPAWEALTMLWRGEATTAEQLAEKLAPRQLTAADYGAALERLAARGWLAERSGSFEVTEQGRALRQQAEDETDQLFYDPWRCLSEGETGELQSLLTQLRDAARRLNERAVA